MQDGIGNNKSLLSGWLNQGFRKRKQGQIKYNKNKKEECKKNIKICGTVLSRGSEIL